MISATLEKVFACPNLPTLPAVALKVLELTGRPDVSLKQVASVIENDQAIAAKVLRTINSSFYGLSRRCGSIQQALALLGLQTVKGLVLGFSLVKSIDGGGEKEVSFDFLSYWRRCMYSAAAARQIAEITRRCDPEEAFVASLVQDVGMVALWRVFGDRYLQTIDVAGKDHRRLVQVERKSLETDHAAIGGEMLRRWRFPEPIINAVRCHHGSSAAPLDSMHIARVVELAGLAAAVVLGESEGSQERIDRFRVAAHEWFNIRGAHSLAMLQKISDLAQQLARVFSLDMGEVPDVDLILAQAESIRSDQKLPQIQLEEECAAEIRDEIDPVTGLPDRTVLVRDLDSAFANRSQLGSGTGIGLVVIALDDVRRINERQGPMGADVVLGQVGASIAEAVGRFGRAYRFVGASFAALLPKVDLEQLARVAELCRRKVGETIFRVEGAAGTESMHLTVTCGVAICEGDASIREASGVANRDQLLRAAMVALSDGQQKGRNRVTLFGRDGVGAKAA
jgi:diguanylate cyclase (GGDEF)-like protein